MSSSSEQDFSEDIQISPDNSEFSMRCETSSVVEPSNGSSLLIVVPTPSTITVKQKQINNFTASSDIPKGSDDNAAEDRKLFVGGLSWETKEPQLKDYFERFGPVESVNLKFNALTGKSRCFAFVVFKEASDLAKVFENGEHAINSKKVDVKRAKAKPGKIFIGGLKPELSDDEIRKYFEQFGVILEFEMPVDKVKNQRKTFGFITFEREETMKELIKKNKVTIGDYEVDLRKATPKNDFRGKYLNNDFNCYGSDYYGGYYYGYTVPTSPGGGKIKTEAASGTKRTTPY